MLKNKAIYSPEAAVVSVWFQQSAALWTCSYFQSPVAVWSTDTECHEVFLPADAFCHSTQWTSKKKNNDLFSSFGLTLLKISSQLRTYQSFQLKLQSLLFGLQYNNVFLFLVPLVQEFLTPIPFPLQLSLTLKFSLCSLLKITWKF